MSTRLPRRRFLQVTTLAGLGLSTGTVRSALAADAPATRLRVACRDAMLRHTGQADCFAAMKRIGVEGVEVDATDQLALPGLMHPTTKYSIATPEGIARLKADFDAAGLKITAFCMHNQFEARPDFEVDWSTKVAQAAKALGVSAIRIDVVPRKLDRAAFLPFAVDILKKVLSATEATGVAFAIENHGNTTNDPAFLEPLFAGVGSPRLSLTLDTGNFYWFGHPLSRVYQLYEQFAPRVRHTHMKSIGYPADQRETQRPMGWKYGEYTCPIYAGDIDMARVVKILRAAGYANDLCIENESLGKRPPVECIEVLGKEAKLLRDLAG
jgi:sugar phosphate isomerase/epimerase